MKKFFSLICALAIVLGANAIPTKRQNANLVGKKAQVAEMQFKKFQAEKQNKLVQKTTTFVDRAPKAQATGVRKAPKATTNVTVSKVSSTYYDTDGDVFYVLYNEDQTMAFCFDIYCAVGSEDVVSGQTYTLADMYAEYCEWAYTDDPYNGTAFSSASFTKTVAADGSYTIVATATDVEGDVWNLNAAVAAPTISQKTLNLNGFVELGTYFQQIEAANADTTELVSLLIYSDDVQGTFTEDDLYTYYSYILADSAEYDIQSADFTVAYNYENSVYEVTGTITGENYDDPTDIVIFTINLSCTGEVPPAPFPTEAKDTIALDFGEVVSLAYYSSSQDYYIYAERADYIVALDIFTNEIAGAYTYDDFDTYYTQLAVIIAGDTALVGDVEDANAVIVETETAYNINAELFMSDTILYQLHMTYTKPVATDTIYHTFAEPVLIENYGGDFYFKAADNTYILQMDYYSNNIAGTYTLSDMYTKYCGLYNASDSSKIAYNDLSLVITEDETGYDITVDYFATNSNYYIFTLRSNKVVANDTVQLNLENAEYTDVSAYSWYYGFSHYFYA